MNLKKVFLLVLVFTFVSTAFVTTLQAQNVTVQRGERTITNPDGSVYVGQVRNMLPHGRGTMTFPDGRTVTGQWRNGQLQEEKAVAQREKKPAVQREQKTVVKKEPRKKDSKSWSSKLGVGRTNYSRNAYWEEGLGANLTYGYRKEERAHLSLSAGVGFNYFFMDNLTFISELNLQPGYSNGIYITTPVGINWFFGKYFFTGAGLYYAQHILSYGRYSGDSYMLNKFEGSHLGLFADLGLAFNLHNNTKMLRVFGRYNHAFSDANTKILSLNAAVDFFF